MELFSKRNDILRLKYFVTLIIVGLSYFSCNMKHQDVVYSNIILTKDVSWFVHEFIVSNKEKVTNSNILVLSIYNQNHDTSFMTLTIADQAFTVLGSQFYYPIDEYLLAIEIVGLNNFIRTNDCEWKYLKDYFPTEYERFKKNDGLIEFTANDCNNIPWWQALFVKDSLIWYHKQFHGSNEYYIE